MLPFTIKGISNISEIKDMNFYVLEERDGRLYLQYYLKENEEDMAVKQNENCLKLSLAETEGKFAKLAPCCFIGGGLFRILYATHELKKIFLP